MNRKVWLGLFVSMAVLAVLAGSVAAQQNSLSSASGVAAKSGGKLSPRLAALAQSPTLRAASAEEQASALSLPPQGAGSLLRNEQGQLLVYVRMNDVSESQVQALRDAGAQIIHVSDRYGVVTAFVDAVSLTSIASRPAVQSMEEGLTPMAGSDTSISPPSSAVAPAATCPSGAIVSEGDTQLNAALARSTHHVDGSGVKVGILSDSFDRDSGALTHASNDIASGDLPGPGNPCGQLTAVNVISESLTTSVSDEGRAMVEIVHDLAPTSTLMFASAWNGLFAFGDNIRNLRTAGADIIADDVFYFAEPFFQEGPINVAISDVVHSGALYFALAGNNNYLLNGQDVGSYEAPSYRPTTCPAGLPSYAGATCHDFDPGPGVSSSSAITLANGGALALDLQWNEPWYGVTDDFDVYLLNDANSVVASSENTNSTTQTPFEYFSYTNGTGSTRRYRIVINRYSGSGTPRLKYMFIQSTSGVLGVQYNTSNGGDIVGPTLYGHSSSQYGLSVAAVPYNNSNTPEDYTSRGPATHYFGPVVGVSPAAAISPETIQQPDFAATDGGCTTFFGGFSSGCYRFYGTSAATPHAAAVAALLKQKANQSAVTLTPALTKSILQSTARTVSGGDVNSVGAGLIDANAALDGITLTPPQIISALSASGTVGEAFSYTVVATGSLPITFTTSAMPTGLALHDAIISGTPTLTGTFPVTLTATNSAGSDSKQLVITIQPAMVTPPAITSALVATGTVGIPFSYTVTASGTLPITLTVTGLPAWAGFTSPVISGAPTVTGTFPITLTATNSAGSDDKTLVISILAGFQVYLPAIIR